MKRLLIAAFFFSVNVSAYEVNLNNLDLSQEAVQAVKQGFDKHCSRITNQVSELKLIKSEKTIQRIDQGYVDMYWNSSFEIVYKEGSNLKSSKLFTQVTQELENRSGVLGVSLTDFLTLNNESTNSVCDF